MPPFIYHLPRTLAAFLMASTALVVAACSSSTNSGVTAPVPSATPVVSASPSPTPSPAPSVSATPSGGSSASPAPTSTPIVRGSAACAAGSAPVTATITFQNGVVQMPTVGGCAASFTFTGIASPVTATVTAQLTAPANYPPAPAAPQGFTGQSATPVYYFTFKLNSALTVGGPPITGFTVPSTIAAGSNNFYNLSADLGPATPGSIGGGAVSYGGPGVVSGTAVTFQPNSGNPSITLAANETYVLSLNYF